MPHEIFYKNLRKLREEKHLSQKSVAASLGISQALLSHYEKGIRECGLDFLVRIAKFYNVSTDFMLGVSRNVKTQTENKIICKDNELKKDEKNFNIYSALYKNLLTNSISYIFDNLKDTEYKDISILAGKHLSLSVYNLYSLLNNDLNKNNPFENYNSENTYLNMILNGVDIKI